MLLILYIILVLVLINSITKGKLYDTLKNFKKINTYSYCAKLNPMTKTENDFIKILEKYTNERNLLILPQVNLQAIFKSPNEKAFYKICAKSIDFAIVDKEYNYKLFIELDDYTHTRPDRIQRDNFINELFQNNNLKIIRIKVQNQYDENTIKDLINSI